jgi:hypothetical protein
VPAAGTCAALWAAPDALADLSVLSAMALSDSTLAGTAHYTMLIWRSG